MTHHLTELEQHLCSLDGQAQTLLQTLYVEEKLRNYKLTELQPHKFVLVVDNADTAKKLVRLDPQAVMARLVRAEKAARTIQTTLRDVMVRLRRRKVIKFHSILRILTMCSLRDKVETLGTTRYKKLLQIKGMVFNQRANKLNQEKLKIGLQTLQRAVFDGFLRRAGFAMFMLKDYVPKSPGQSGVWQPSVHKMQKFLLIRPHRKEEMADDMYVVSEPPRKYRPIESRYTDPFHALIFQNFAHIGRTTGKYSMAERFEGFLSTAKGFYGLLAFAKGIHQ